MKEDYEVIKELIKKDSLPIFNYLDSFSKDISESLDNNEVNNEEILKEIKHLIDVVESFDSEEEIIEEVPLLIEDESQDIISEVHVDSFPQAEAFSYYSDLGVVASVYVILPIIFGFKLVSPIVKLFKTIV